MGGTQERTDPSPEIGKTVVENGYYLPAGYSFGERQKSRKYLFTLWENLIFHRDFYSKTFGQCLSEIIRQLFIIKRSTTNNTQFSQTCARIIILFPIVLLELSQFC